MNESEWKSVPEEFENIRDKWDYLDWDRLPAGPCDMNYRPSAAALERSALFIGLHTLYDYPMLLDGGLLFEHLHLLGGTGTGKTALGLTTHMIQLIRRDDGPVVIIDCKGDPALFHTARLEAQKAGRIFKWLTNKPGRATYLFNPLDSRAYRHFTLAETVGTRFALSPRPAVARLKQGRFARLAASRDWKCSSRKAVRSARSTLTRHGLTRTSQAAAPRRIITARCALTRSRHFRC